MDANIEAIISKDINKLSEALKYFSEKFSSEFTFPQLKRAQLWKSLDEIICDVKFEEHLPLSLTAIRILSRDKQGLDELITAKLIDEIVKHAALTAKEKCPKEAFKLLVIVEALKCLSNLVYNSTVAADCCCKNGTIEGIMERVQLKGVIYEIKFVDMRLLFLLSGMCKETRPIICNKLNGFKILVENLELEINSKRKINQLSSQDSKYLCEIIKVLFNISLNMDENTENDSSSKLVSLLREIALANVDSEQEALEMFKQIIFILTSVQSKSLKNFIRKSDLNLHSSCVYKDCDMTSIQKILKLLKITLESSHDEANQNDLLIPILTTLLRLACSDRIVRKYLRREILPPLKDVHHRPEEGKTLRNRLCKLLTSPNTQLKNLSAELLFVLCKENVERMIKYTGYGNAAGLFTTHGLLAGREEAANGRPYSSESEDSDTEEYLNHLHGINPVVGCYEPPKSNPCANMTEEQKEYEAMKLVEMMDKLTKSGIVKPCTIGEDGRPQPIEHVLQLQEGLLRTQLKNDKEN